MSNQAYHALRDQVRTRGLLDRSGWNSLPEAMIIVALGVVGFAVVALAPGLWRFAAVPILSQMWMQIGFIGHDAGHNQVFARTELNRRLGLVCFPLLLGMAFRPWVIQHNLHHAETNVLDEDPDLDHPLFAFSEAAARERRGVLRWMVRYQAYLYPFLAVFTTLAFRVVGWRYAFTGVTIRGTNDRYDRERRFELVLLALNLVLWVAVPSAIFGARAWLPIFILGQMLLGFHMAFVFAPNHKGMPTFVDASQLTFMEQQVLTSRNVDGGPLADFMYGGLNYQVEHHLFPTMPRRHFPTCRLLVRQCCADARLDYTEESVVQSFKTLFASLDEIGREAFRPLSVSSSAEL